MSLTIANTEVPAGTWDLDPSHSTVGFVVRHAGISKVRGEFKEFDATVKVGDSVEDTTVKAVIDVASFDSGDKGRDGHVLSGDFFDVEQFPKWSFDSTAIRNNGGEFELEGNLTIKGITRPVIFDVEVNGATRDPFGLFRAGLEASTVISRKDFGITWNAALETGGVLVSDKVTINLDLSFILEEETAA